MSTYWVICFHDSYRSRMIREGKRVEYRELVKPIVDRKFSTETEALAFRGTLPKEVQSVTEACEAGGL